MVHLIPEEGTKGLGVKHPAARVLDSRSMATKYDPTRHREVHYTHPAILTRKPEVRKQNFQNNKRIMIKGHANVLMAVPSLDW